MAERGRRVARVSGDSRQQAILATAEALLETRSLDDISIEELATGAGISRSNFYFYFGSKDEVLLALLDRVITEVRHRVAALPRDFESAPLAAWTRSIGVFVEVFASHRAIATEAMTPRFRGGEASNLWSTSMQAWIDYSTEIILAERARGAAPGGIDARELAIALDLMNERVIASALGGEAAAIDQDHLVTVLAHIWVQSIYAAAPAHQKND